MDFQSLQNQINDLTTKVNLLSRSSTIPREVETAFTERFANRTFIKGFFLWGQATLVAGTITVVDNRIKPDSIAMISLSTTAATAVDIKAVCTLNTATFTSQSGADVRVINYLILL